MPSPYERDQANKRLMNAARIREQEQEESEKMLMPGEPTQPMSAAEKLRVSAEQRRLERETKELARHAKIGVADPSEDLVRVTSRYPHRQPYENLPEPTHHFKFPLSAKQFSQLQPGDRIHNYSLIKAFRLISEDNPAWLDPLGKRVLKYEDDVRCELTVAEVNRGNETLIVQLQLPMLKTLPESENWEGKIIVFQLEIVDVLSLWEEIKHHLF